MRFCMPPKPAPVADQPDSALRRAVLLLGALLPLRGWAQAAPGPIGVVFPDIGEPFRKVFIEIIDGIEDRARMKVRGYPVSATQDPAELSATVKRNGIRVVIALGRQGLKACTAVEAPVIVSGVSSVPDGERQLGICLTPDPALLFAHLKNLMPAVRRVLIVYNPLNNEWLLKLAREAARAGGVELAPFEARDLASAARQYESALGGANGKHDALWLPIDATTVDESTILPLVLRESWNRNVPVFSTSLLHVKRGALFALYPNNVDLGRNLANLATATLAGEALPRGVTPLRDVLSAVNLRTASHLGVMLSPRVLRSFNFLYPEP